MQLLILWREAQAAQRRLRDTFRDSRKPSQELTLEKWQYFVSTMHDVHLRAQGRERASVLATCHSSVCVKKGGFPTQHARPRIA